MEVERRRNDNLTPAATSVFLCVLCCLVLVVLCCVKLLCVSFKALKLHNHQLIKQESGQPSHCVPGVSIRNSISVRLTPLVDDLGTVLLSSLRSFPPFKSPSWSKSWNPLQSLNHTSDVITNLTRCWFLRGENGAIEVNHNWSETNPNLINRREILPSCGLMSHCSSVVQWMDYE